MFSLAYVYRSGSAKGKASWRNIGRTQGRGCCLFRNTQRPEPNLSTSQLQAIKSLWKRNDIVILKAVGSGSKRSRSNLAGMVARTMQSRNSKLILCPFCFFYKIDCSFCLQNCFFLLAAHFAQILLSKFCQGLLMGNTSSYVKNSKHFSEMTSSETVTGNEVMVSFDVKSLFINVPIEHALELIYERLLEDETLEYRTQLSAEQVTLLLSICLRTT